MARHRITDVDPELRRGVCSECGPVDVYPNREYWTCGPLHRARAQRWQASEACESARLLRRYGITIDQYKQMLRDQNGLCARCATPADGMKVRLSVDHCHKTGVVRKLLCAPCNTYLGKLETYRHRLEQDLLYLDTGSFEPVLIEN